MTSRLDASTASRRATLERVKMDMYISQPFDLACLYASVGDQDKAFESLETAYRNRSYKIAVLEVTPQLDPLRHDPDIKTSSK